MQALAEQQQWPVGWAFDGLKNMYTPDAFLPQHETHYEVCCACLHALHLQCVLLKHIQQAACDFCMPRWIALAVYLGHRCSHDKEYPTDRT